MSQISRRRFYLLTSDGGIDCSTDPEFQEQNSAGLKQAEYENICAKLEPGGNAVLKVLVTQKINSKVFSSVFSSSSLNLNKSFSISKKNLSLKGAKDANAFRIKFWLILS